MSDGFGKDRNGAILGRKVEVEAKARLSKERELPTLGRKRSDE